MNSLKQTGKEEETKEYSLILRDRDKILFSSKKKGLLPLLECVIAWHGKVNNTFLTDKVVGGAAARVIIESKMIGTVMTGVISNGALKLLESHSIPVKWKERADIILRSDRKKICLMEDLSRRNPDNNDFFPALFRHFSLNIPDWI